MCLILCRVSNNGTKNITKMTTKLNKAQGKKSATEKQSKSALVPKSLIKRIKEYAKDNELLYDTQIAAALDVNIKTLKNIFDGRCSPVTIDRIKLKIAA